MNSAQNIEKRIERERRSARIAAFAISLPVFAIAVAIAFMAVDLTIKEAPRNPNSLQVAASMLFAAFLLVVLSQWTFAFVRAIATPQRIQAIWLRRFQAEGGRAFRTSRVIDRLSRYGISSLTMQDRDVRLSWEHRRNRLAPVFWLAFAGAAPPLALFIWAQWQSAHQQALSTISNLPHPQNFNETVGQIFSSALTMALSVAAVAVLAIVLAFVAIIALMFLASIVGPIGAIGSRYRDDFRKIPQLLRRIARGKRSRGAQVLRISNENWREAVHACLGVVDVAIIDLSTVSASISWEIDEAVKVCGLSSLVFIARAGRRGEPILSDEATEALRVVGRDRSNARVAFYPFERSLSRSGEERFSRALRESIYAAVTERRAVPTRARPGATET